MTPLDWVALPVYLLTPMAFIFAGNGDLRKKDERYLAHLQTHMFIPGVWGLAVSWFALSVLIGVAGFLFWRDAAAATLYEHTLGLWWVNLICLMVWFRLAKMQYLGAAFAVKLAVVGTAIAAVVLMGKKSCPRSQSNFCLTRSVHRPQRLVGRLWLLPGVRHLCDPVPHLVRPCRLWRCALLQGQG